MTELFSNLGQTSINQIGGISATSTTVIVAALNGTNAANSFPSSGNFRVILGSDVNSEIVLCTAVNTATNTFTIVRAQEGTTAQAWANGTAVTIGLTAQAVNQMRAEVFSVGPYANRPNQGLTTGSYYQTIDGHTPWIWDPGIGAWRPQINGVLGYQPPPASLFSIGVNNTTNTIVDSSKGALDYTGVADTAGSVIFRGFFFNFTGPCFIEACVAHQPNATFVASTWTEMGPALRESATGKLCFMAQGETWASGLSYIASGVFSAPATRTSTTSANLGGEGIAPSFVRLRRDLKNVYFEYSRDRIVWSTISTQALTSVFTTAPDQIGFGGFSAGAAAFMHILSFNYGPLYSPIINVPPPSPPSPTTFTPSMGGYISPIINR